MKTIVGLGSALMLSSAQVALSQGANVDHLTLYSKKDQAGEKRVLVADEPDLATMKASNFAWSLTAVGNWEVCMDPGYRAGCRIVTGTITDLGTDGAAISSARKLAAPAAATSTSAPAPASPSKTGQKSSATTPVKPAPVPAPAPTPATAPTPAPTSLEPAYVYATIGFDKIKPELVINGFGDATNGVYTATQSEAELDAIYRTGTYGITSGRIEGRMSNNVLSGYWYETAYNAGLQGSCERERNGTLVYGRFTLTFNADRTSFSGYRSSCDEEPNAYDHAYLTWTGQLIRRQAAVAVPTSVSDSKMASKSETQAMSETDELVIKAARGILDKVF
ncbi:hypothetical protein K1X12_08815 [Hyphomonas sp. WL0036]|uniref:hypothetical protein n=1 Tax=Hyphomonas sediminis TaxID=2866160 RepID=UPI001C7F596E|nr:hypothetical protein [Hyphomonas sediminis]MBY9066998.1 hypothetical protein [Hyphomonas sediminis]